MRVTWSIFCLLICNSCCCQSKVESTMKYYFPFDSISIVKHQFAINSGESYLILIDADWEHQSYFLVSTGWYELPNTNDRSFSNIDSLLQGYHKELHLSMVPIPESLIAVYNNKSDCDLARMLFTDEGYFKRGRFYVASNIILAALVQRGFEINISDYDGEPFFDLDSANCN